MKTPPYRLARFSVFATFALWTSWALATAPAPNAARSTEETATLLDEARTQLVRGAPQQALAPLEALLAKYPDNPDVLDLLGQVNLRMLLSREPSPGTTFDTVQPKDSLPRIAGRHGMTTDLLMQINGVENGIVRPGMKLKVLDGRFSVRVSKSQNTLTLSLGGRFFKRYHVCTGKNGCTPAGDFEITTNRMKNPVWYKPGGGVAPFGSKENQLGTRWMAITAKGYGIHGTWDRASIGTQGSAGCVRMLNEDVEELYPFLPAKTPVSITD